MTTPQYGFARRPTWIVGHVIALVAIVAFVQLGLWQLRRLEERRTLNEAVTARLDSTYRPFDEIIRVNGADPEAVVWRRVEITGTYALDDEVIVQGRSHRGQSGHHVATPLVRSDGTAVIINRGWVPIDVVGPPVVGAEPPDGEVTVRGIIRESQARGSVGPVDPPTGVLERVARVDVGRLQQQSDLALFGFYVDLESQEPPQAGGSPAPLGPPDLSEGPHFAYALQWFTFAGVVLVGYPLLLRRTADPHRRARRRR